MANEVVKKEEYQLITDEDFDLIVKFDEFRKRYSVVDDKYKSSGHDFLKERGLLETGYKQTKDGVTVHLYEKKGYEKKQADTKELKATYVADILDQYETLPEEKKREFLEKTLYELFTKKIWVKGSVVIQVEYGD